MKPFTAASLSSSLLTHAQYAKIDEEKKKKKDWNEKIETNKKREIEGKRERERNSKKKLNKKVHEQPFDTVAEECV